ncbi:hypothetical protein L873DRAFT_1724107 [Choiromyces venosus 120613-1]|uniref:Uncharacterized protein n=1 Tax=Choiromyces venosus 120613-1 TaxID=1336337 RepID=A0A3N4IRX0_9PEZI|nr:hypothetical protein L873DRAFT_1724107 [Choiromyces venosus 120613-1]
MLANLLSWAAGNGEVEVVKMLLEWTGICPDLPDQPGRTALSWAAGEGYRKVVELLLTRADVNAEYVDSEGRSPLNWALKNRHEGVAAVLREWAGRGEGVELSQNQLRDLAI